ncbi:MAG TPA: CHAD domain-containing protein [Burkholderiales bacterium]|nr:CHAD domain-containing protein [Burkholderiales bacterium]
MRPTPPGLEVELKLLLPREAVRSLNRHRLLRSAGRPARARLRSIYYDTPALDLWRQGITLRVRRDGSRWVQTVKGGGQVRGGLHRRAEAEVEVAGPAPELALLRDRASAGVLASDEIRAQLEPVFTTDFVRVSRILEPQPGVRVEASVDQGLIRSGDRRAELCEFELELKDGAPQHLYQLALQLSEAVPLSICDRSKAERGYALARGRPASPVKARPAALHGAMTVNGAFKAVMWAGLAHLLANAPGMVESRDTEYLHQVRVALRRLRSAIGIFAPPFPDAVLAPVRSDLKWLASRLGPARDWDVFVTETLPAIQATAGAHGALEDFAARCRKLRRSAHAQALRALRSPRYRRFTLSLAARLSSESGLPALDAGARAGLAAPAPAFAATVLEKRYARVRKKGRMLGTLTPRERHRLRIAIKKFRYAADFFSGLYRDAETREALRRLSRLQDILGAMNDAATAAKLAQPAFDAAPGRRARAARAILLEWRRARTATLGRELKSAWNEFRAAGKFW